MYTPDIFLRHHNVKEYWKLTTRLVAQCLNQLVHRVPHISFRKPI